MATHEPNKIKLSRADRKARAREKSGTIQCRAIDIIMETFRKEKNWSEAIESGNRFFRRLMHSSPHEKELILSSGQDLNERINTILKALAKEEKAKEQEILDLQNQIKEAEKFIVDSEKENDLCSQTP